MKFFGGQIFQVVISQKRNNIERSDLNQNDRNGRFPISTQENVRPYLHQITSYSKKKKDFRMIWLELSESAYAKIGYWSNAIKLFIIDVYGVYTIT